ncbi:MAG: hypothetical protein LBS46_04775 [Dysgonamonadaceae bacterium]|jgi:hypothetical protein|nr:hypothetical protein [Dysgonamonadaceae bacterium]
MKTSVTILLLFISLSGYSQTDTVAITDTLAVADRIAAMEYSKSDIISKSRRLLIQDFNEGNRKEVAQTLRYLASRVDDEYHLSLWNYERYLLMYWLGDYSDLLLSIQFAAQDTATGPSPAVYPSDHFLGTTLMNGIRDLYYDEIVADYESMHFSQDTNDFLNMLLNYLLDTISIDERNRLTDKFVNNHPDSPLVEASKKFISYKFATGDFGIGMDMGGGIHLASGPVTDWISQHGGAAMSLNVYYKRFNIGFSIVSSFGRVLQDIDLQQNDKTWPAGERIEVDKMSVTGGIKAWEYKKITLSPFAGVSFNSSAYSDKEIKENPELKDIHLGTSVTPVVGFDLDFRLNAIRPASNPYGYNYYGGYWPGIYTLGIKTAYYPNVIATQGKDLRGSTWFVGLFYKMNFFSVKRVY